MPKRKYKVELNSNKKFPVFDINQFDTLSLEIELSEVSSLKNCETELFFWKPNGTLVSEIITDVEGSTIKIDVKNGVLDTPGNVMVQAKVVDDCGIISSYFFRFKIKKTITSDEAIVNEVGIGVIEKLKYDLANAQIDPRILKEKIQEAISDGSFDVATNTEIAQINSQLEYITYNSSINKIKFGYNATWYLENSIENGNNRTDKMSRCMDTFVLPITANLNSENNLESSRNLDDYIQQIKYAENIGIKLKCVRIQVLLTNMISVLGDEDNAILKYKDFIEKIHLLLNENNIYVEFLTILNEDYNYYSNSLNKDKIIDLLNFVKNLGYKTGICFRQDGISGVEADVINNCDVIFQNYYPIFSRSRENASVNEIVENINAQLDIFKYAKSLFLNKKIIVSEFGLNDNWLALEDPESYYDPTTYPTYVSGIPILLAYTGVVASDLVKYSDEIWCWYYNDIALRENIQNFFKKYCLTGDVI